MFVCCPYLFPFLNFLSLLSYSWLSSTDATTCLMTGGCKVLTFVRHDEQDGLAKMWCRECRSR